MRLLYTNISKYLFLMILLFNFSFNYGMHKQLDHYDHYEQNRGQTRKRSNSDNPNPEKSSRGSISRREPGKKNPFFDESLS